jgi:DnaJ-class molecular chaperone
MADDDEETSESATAEAADEPCMPCRGNGSVISNKGGTPQTVECPWCRGTGIRIPGHDAQAHWGSPGEGGGAEPPDDAA